MFNRVRPHSAGLIYTGIVVLVSIAAMNNQNNLLFWVMGVLAAGLVVSGGMSIWMIWSVRIRRIDPQHGTVGVPLVIRYAVTNRSRLLSAFNLHIDEVDAQGAAFNQLGDPERSAINGVKPQAWVMHVGPRESTHGEAVLWPQQRGRVTFNTLQVWTTFPFGIIRKSRRVTQPQHTLIYPKMFELRHGLLKSITPPSLLGTKVSHHAGAGDDYYGTREYRPGDSMRHIAWKRAAKTDQLVTIERTNPSPARLRIILDLTMPTATLQERLKPAAAEAAKGTAAAQAKSARDLEERAIMLAASIVHAADLEGYEIGLTVLGLSLPPIPLRRNRWHFNKIMAALAEIDLDAPRVPATAQPIRDAERTGIVVLAPDRARPIAGLARDDAMYLTAHQLESFAVRQIGWDEASLHLHAAEHQQRAAVGTSAAPLTTAGVAA